MWPRADRIGPTDSTSRWVARSRRGPSDHDLLASRLEGRTDSIRGRLHRDGARVVRRHSRHDVADRARSIDWMEGPLDHASNPWPTASPDPPSGVHLRGNVAAHIATITCKGFEKAYRRGEVEELYFVRLHSTQPAPSANPPDSDDPDVKKLLTEFADVFPAALPNAVETPNRGVEHRIELKPGSRIPPSRPLRHQSSKDAAAMRDYVQAGVESG